MGTSKAFINGFGLALIGFNSFIAVKHCLLNYPWPSGEYVGLEGLPIHLLFIGAGVLFLKWRP